MHSDANASRRNIGAVIDQDLRLVGPGNFSKLPGQPQQVAPAQVALAYLQQINSRQTGLCSKFLEPFECRFIRRAWEFLPLCYQV